MAVGTGVKNPLGGLVAGATTPEAVALWVLVALELGLQVVLRRYFRRHHGG